MEQKLFYNYLTNHSKGDILKRGDATDEEILNYGGKNPPEEGFKLRDGFLKIRGYELRLAGMPEEEIAEALAKLSDEEIVAEIKRYAEYGHYGHYASNLPDAAKSALAAGLEENAQKLLEKIQPLMAKGTKISMIQGNWDARAPIDFVPGIPEVKPLKPEERLFNPQQFFKENGVDFYSDATTVETKTSIHILFPFDAITSFSDLPQEKKDDISRKVSEARENNKTVILVGHGEPNYKVHYLANPDVETPAGEHQKLIAGYNEILGLYLPDEVIYGHLHDLLTDSQGNKLDPNTKYALRVVDGIVELVPEVDEIDSNSILATYMPLKRMATLEIPTKTKNKRPDRLGGTRHQAYVK